ncbi:hypothetical protein [Roseibium sp.]|uniref:hypothetical protein n=1 Tax=Roseibium sp. TaxID=1936156 RepID=UPI003BAA58BC
MILKLKALAACAVLTGTFSAASLSEEFGYVGDNHSWSLSCNASGYVLKSQYPVTRFFEAGAASSVTRERETLYLGRSCDASSTTMGEGKWCWANGGFFAEFATHRISFPRQEVICPRGGNDSLACGC